VRLVRGHPFLSVLAVALLAVVTVIGWSGVTVWRAAHHDDASDVDGADAIVVLGAAQYDGKPSPVFQGRLDHALLLWQQGRSPLVLTVGANQPGDAHTEAEAGKTYLVAQGIPTADVIDIPVGHTTFESLRAAAGYLRDNGLHTAFLVSDPWHNARVKAMAGDLGLTGYASATWTSAARSEESRGKGYLRETFAYVFYRVFGR
jgi:uncharacterized SAM-binding protein YcdF (DUF218 family)